MTYPAEKKGKGSPASGPVGAERGFYSRALDEAEGMDFELAHGVEGIDDEIALLRVKIKSLLESDPDRAFTLLLYHSPDLMPEAVELGIDLYLCGHTHGGQIRLPLLGAVLTSSDFWKRYEMGRYEEGKTTLYVSRGLGLEEKGAPHARFLAPPEIILWTLSQ